MCLKRVIASIIDIVILVIIFGVLLSFWPLSNDARQKYADIYKIESSVKDYNSLTTEQKKEISEISYEIDHELVKYYLMFSLVLIVYFIFIPKFRNDQTFGQKAMKIRLVSDEKITMNTYVIRAVLNSGIVLLLFSPLALYIFNIVWYSRVTSLIMMIQVAYWIFSFIMLMGTKETIHDHLTKTKIIEVKR